MAQHVALKCTYNNGGEDDFVGFNGTCSEDIIKWNIEHGRVWCSQNQCGCRKYYDSGFKGKYPIDPCYESVLFRKWQYGAGAYHTGKRAGMPIHLSNVGKGKIAILTTRFLEDPEEDRRIIGLFKIGRVVDSADHETIMVANKYFRVRLPLDEAKELYFWDYYSTKGGTRWNTGLVRYLNDAHVFNILIDLYKTLHYEKTKKKIAKLIDIDFKYYKENPPAPLKGPRRKKSGDRTKRVLLKRKYGVGGEGKDHKRLKKWVAEHPKQIGLADVVDTEEEYSFLSGDTVDIIFKLQCDKYAVVEIETINPLPGCHQVLKYKVLKCAELGVDIKSAVVEPIIVAWSIPKEVRRFCNKYCIRYIEKKV